MEDEIDCSNFVITDNEPKRFLILKDDLEFESVVKK